MAGVRFDSQDAMAELAKVAANRFRDDLRSKIIAQLEPMIDEVLADITNQMEARAFKQSHAMCDQIIIQYIRKDIPHAP